MICGKPACFRDRDRPGFLLLRLLVETYKKVGLYQAYVIVIQSAALAALDKITRFHTVERRL